LASATATDGRTSIARFAPRGTTGTFSNWRHRHGLLPFFHLAPRPAVGLRITTRRDRSRAMCCNALGIDGGRLPATAVESTLSAVLPLNPSIRNIPQIANIIILMTSSLMKVSFFLSENVE